MFFITLKSNQFEKRLTCWKNDIFQVNISAEKFHVSKNYLGMNRNIGRHDYTLVQIKKWNSLLQKL